MVQAPHWDEIGVKNMYKRIVSQPELAKFFPEKFPKGSQCDKTYMFNVWNSIKPEQVKLVIDHANSQRYSLQNEEVKQNSIVLTEDWQRELESMPFVSKQKGKMCALLKMKSAIGVQRKPRKTYEPVDFMKRPRDYLEQISGKTLAPTQSQT